MGEWPLRSYIYSLGRQLLLIDKSSVGAFFYVKGGRPHDLDFFLLLAQTSSFLSRQPHLFLPSLSRPFRLPPPKKTLGDTRNILSLSLYFFWRRPRELARWRTRMALPRPPPLLSPFPDRISIKPMLLLPADPLSSLRSPSPLRWFSVPKERKRDSLPQLTNEKEGRGIHNSFAKVRKRERAGKENRPSRLIDRMEREREQNMRFFAY